MPIVAVSKRNAKPVPASIIDPPSRVPRDPPKLEDAAALATEAPRQVGYKNPPKETRFKPGQSGNPKGRPKTAKGLKTVVREMLTQKVSVRTPDGSKRIARIEAVLHKALELAMKGNIRALTEILKAYASAVPDITTTNAAGVAEDLTETDRAVLDEYLAMVLAGEASNAVN
jgi:hypothetical protein